MLKEVNGLTRERLVVLSLSRRKEAIREESKGTGKTKLIIKLKVKLKNVSLLSTKPQAWMPTSKKGNRQGGHK